MTVAELIAELKKMPQDADVSMWVEPGRISAELVYVERRYNDTVFLNDAYFTPYYDADEKKFADRKLR